MMPKLVQQAQRIWQPMGISETKQARTYVDGWQKPIKEYAEYASNSSHAKENHVYIEAKRVSERK
jgi:hypothetical protein